MTYLKFLKVFNLKVLAMFGTESAPLRSCRRKCNKLKAESINALRQKYEAFIEDDRKRKERNEYILSQLDKMRTCNSLVQKYKLKPFEENLAMFQKVPITETPPPVGGVTAQQRRSFQMPDRNHSELHEQTSLLKKILSNFILIPKRTSEKIETKKYSEPQDENVDNTDWKAKYEILNVLKNAEKRGSVTENIYDPLTDQGVEIHQFENRVQSFDIVKNVQDKDIFFDEMNEPSSIKKPTDSSESYPAKVGKDSKDDDKTITFDTSNDAHESDINEIGNQKKEDHIKGNEKLVYDDENGLNPAHMYYPHEDIGKPFGDIPIETEDVQYPIEIINVDDFTPRDDVILKDGENINPRIEEKMKKTSDQLPSGDLDANVVISTQESPLRTQAMKEPTDKPLIKAIDVGDSSNIVHHSSEPRTDIVINEIVDRTDTKDIQEFENEQEMFYEHTEILDNKNPLEQPEEVFTPLDENFQDQQYYYVAPHETSESVHINEHEETSYPYDQSYAQQYLTAQAQDYAEAPDVVTATDNQWKAQPAYEEQETYEGKEQLYDSQQRVQGQEQQEYERQEQQYEGEQQQYEGQQQHYEGHQLQYEGQQQQYEGEQGVYDQNAIYDNTHLQSAYDSQNDMHMQYNQELYPADGTFETTEQVESQLDTEEGFTQQHNIMPTVENKEVVPE